MAFNVAEFRSQMTGDGARPNLFAVTLTFPNNISNAGVAGQKVTFMAKASQLPGSSFGTISQHYFGREVKFVGNRTFANWSITVINDEDFSIRNAVESWMNSMNSNAGNVRDTAYSTPSSYSVDAQVVQYGKTGNVLKTYNFVGMFPVDIAPIDLSWDSNDTIEEFSIEFGYQYWESNTTS